MIPVSYRISFFLFFIRARNPVSGPESGFGARTHSQVTPYLANLLVSYRLSFFLFSIRAPNPLSGPESTFEMAPRDLLADWFS